MADEGGYLPLVVVAEQTGASLRSLREWCATGRLACERSDGTWTLRATDIDKVRQLRDRQPLARRRVTFILPVERATAEVERAMLQQLSPGSSAARLTIDSMDYVAFTAEADGEAIQKARELIENAGGQLLDP